MIKFKHTAFRILSKQHTVTDIISMNTRKHI